MTTNNVNSMEQVTLLDFMSEEDQAQLAPVVEEKKNGKSAVKTTKVAPKPADEPEPDYYEIDRTVFYAGHRMDVPSREMKLEDVRAWLEETFPELTKENTEMKYNKETGHVVPVLKGHKKGVIPVLTEHPTKPVPVYHFLDDQGTTHEIRQTQTGRFTAPIHGAGELLDKPFELFVPRIPLSVLEEIVTKFQAEPEQEHLAYVVWSSYSGYSVIWPEQSADAVSVEGDGIVETEDRFVVAHIHSHGRLPAFFSGQDNADEIRTGLYGVVGHADQDKPRLRFRYSCGGRFVLIDPREIFSGDIEGVVRV